MSPEMFPVINSELATLVSKEGVARPIRNRVISFLKKLIAQDTSFTSLIFDKISLDRYLQFNLLEADKTSVS